MPREAMKLHLATFRAIELPRRRIPLVTLSHNDVSVKPDNEIRPAFDAIDATIAKIRASALSRSAELNELAERVVAAEPNHETPESWAERLASELSQIRD
jgi:hypothetical protein